MLDRPCTLTATERPSHAGFAGRILVVGGGSVAQALLPLLLKHIELDRTQLTLIDPDPEAGGLATRLDIGFECLALARGQFGQALGTRLGPGDLLLNLALGVGSLDLIDWCHAHGVLYVDSHLEPWPGELQHAHEARAAALRRRRPGAPTAVVAHGANPGLVTHFLKDLLLNLALASNLAIEMGRTQPAWADLARRLGVQIVQVTEFDSQMTRVGACAGTFANTWSARGLAQEMAQPSEMGWGHHETALPAGARLAAYGLGNALLVEHLGGPCRVQSWSPRAGWFEGTLLAHHDALSLCDLLTPHQGPGRPTVFYAVRPCVHADPALLQNRQDARAPPPFKVLLSELAHGANELGVLLLGAQGGHWFGSHLALEHARKLVPSSNATTLQVAAGVLGGIVWALENPWRGVVEAEDMDFRRVLQVASPYLGSLTRADTDWRPAQHDRLRFEDFLLPDLRPHAGSPHAAYRPPRRSARVR